MHQVRYLLIGGGLAADAAAHAIRELDADGSITILAQEPHAPYNRPPLSKGLWKGDAEDTLWRATEKTGAEILTGRTAAALDPRTHTVTDDRGGTYRYEKLLLATGGTPRTLPDAPSGVIYFRTLADYRALREQARDGKRFVVIGGGFIGSEIAAALAMNDRKVTMIFPEFAIGARVYPRRLAEFLNGFYAMHDVDVLPDTGVAGVARHGKGWLVHTTTGTTIEADGVVAGLGITPNDALARAAGLTVDNGIVVDRFCRTDDADIFAAGDVARFPSAALQTRVRVEHEDNANTMGAVAGRNMAGAATPYDHLPYFYSDLFDLGYEAVGELDARLETVEDWTRDFREGVIYYRDRDRVRGVLLWNVWGQLDAARAMIAGHEPAAAHELAGKLPVA